MATKKEVLEAALRGEGELGRAADDEPVFVLRAQDLLASDLVCEWGWRLQGLVRGSNKARNAFSIAQNMRDWQQRNQAKLPD